MVVFEDNQAMSIRWKFWKRPVSPERLEELQRIVDEAEDGDLIPMTTAEFKAFTRQSESKPKSDAWTQGTKGDVPDELIAFTKRILPELKEMHKHKAPGSPNHE